MDETGERTLPLARRPNERFHVVEIPFQRATSAHRNAVFGLRNAALERFRALYVIRFLELPSMDAQVPVGCLHELLQIVEAHRFVHGERAENAEAQSLVNEAIEREWAFGWSPTAYRPKRSGGLFGLRIGVSSALCFSHRASSRSRARTECANHQSRR